MQPRHKKIPMMWRAQPYRTMGILQKRKQAGGHSHSIVEGGFEEMS